jgi:hypothetical protein
MISKKKQLNQLQADITAQRQFNKLTASEIDTLQFQLADSFLSVPEDIQRPPANISNLSFMDEMVTVDETRLQQQVNG